MSHAKHPASCSPDAECANRFSSILNRAVDGTPPCLLMLATVAWLSVLTNLNQSQEVLENQEHCLKFKEVDQISPEGHTPPIALPRQVPRHPVKDASVNTAM